MGALYVSDLDGTLLQADGTLSARSRETLNELLDAGLQFTVASGRSVATIRELVASLKLQLPVIEINGAYITDLATGEHLAINAMTSAEISAVYGYLVANGLTPLVSGFDGRADRLFYADEGNEGTAWHIRGRARANDPRLRQLADMRDALAHQVVALTVIDRESVVKTLAQALEEQFGATLDVHYQEIEYVPGWYWLNVHSQRATKAQAIQMLRAELGISAEETVVFGDQVNDAHMFAAADRAVAVGNAIPSIKALATEVIGPNSADSVAQFIQSDFVKATSHVNNRSS